MESLRKQSGGKAIVYARYRKNEASKPGVRVAYQKTYSYKVSRDSKAEDTKDGKVSKGGSLEGTLSLEILSSNQDIVDELQEAHILGEQVEFWIIYTDTPGSKANTYAARYMRADLTSVDESGDSDNLVSLKIESSIEGGYARKGEVTLDSTAVNVDYNFQEIGVVNNSEKSTSASAPTK